MSQTLLIVMLHPHTEEEDLRDLFEPFGAVHEVRIDGDRTDTARSRGRAWVTFADPEAARDARDAVDRTIVDGRQVRVSFADPES